MARYEPIVNELDPEDENPFTGDVDPGGAVGGDPDDVEIHQMS